MINVNNTQVIIPKKHVVIHIGQYYASRNPVVIQTLLGSCVGVCLFDPENHIGGLNHILLPGKADFRSFNHCARYGIHAMELLINRIMRLGGNKQKFQAKVFGGAHLLPAISKENGIGRKNLTFVMDFLENESIPIVSKDIGGYKSRKIYFHTDTGEVYLKRIRSSMNSLFLYEKQFVETLKNETVKMDNITLFS